MELVYLWVEDYKNIHQQGFNFSGRYRCNYDPDKNALTIDENKEYVNIFPDNINVTAIVGENGSGKSSVLNTLTMKSKMFIVVFDNELKIYTNGIEVSSPLTQEKYKTSFLRKVLYYCSIDNINLAESRSYLTTINPFKTNALITENYLKLQGIDSELFNFKPHYISYTFRDFWLDSNYDIDDVGIEHIKSVLDWNGDDSYMISNALNELKSINDEYLLYLFNRFESVEQIFEHINIIEKLHPKDLNLIVNVEDVKEALKKCGIDFEEKVIFELFQENANIFIEIEKLESMFGVDYIELFFSKMFDQLEFDFMAENKSTYSSLSHGEKTIYSFLVHLVHYEQKEFLFLLDEPDNTLHPDWQKRFLKELINITIKLEKQVHLIMTSHSPFILSDLSKNNVIFLKKTEDENCTNVTKEINIDIFGANIHTLLSHGFFMKDGLMGEFAKEKINTAITYLNKKQLLEEEIAYCENIISIIGEPILKRQLQKMLDSKRLSEVEHIKKQIKELQDELAKKEDKR